MDVVAALEGGVGALDAVAPEALALGHPVALRLPHLLGPLEEEQGGRGSLHRGAGPVVRDGEPVDDDHPLAPQVQPLPRGDEQAHPRRRGEQVGQEREGRPAGGEELLEIVQDQQQLAVIGATEIE